MSDTAATRRQLKIKAGVVKRYQKELVLYHTEVVENKTKLESLIASGADIESWEAKNATSLIRESENMVHDTTTRLERAAGELKDLVDSAKRNPELEQGPELNDAAIILATVIQNT